MNQQIPKETGETYAFAPILNFSLDATELKLARGITIRSPTAEERKVVKQFAGYHAPERWGEWNYIACSSPHRKIGDTFSVHLECIGELVNLCRALKLFKRGSLGFGPEFQMDVTTMECLRHSGSSVIIDWSMFFDKKYSLPSGELPDFESFYNKFCHFDFSTNRRLLTALIRFDFSYEVGLMYRPIDLMIAFEALYLGKEQELSYKIATRAAYLLGDTPERRAFIYSLLRNAYDIRSKLVHGEDIPDKVKIAKSRPLDTYKFVFEVEDILRESIRKFMDLLTRYSHKQLLTTLLDDNVLAGGSLL